MSDESNHNEPLDHKRRNLFKAMLYTGIASAGATVFSGLGSSSSAQSVLGGSLAKQTDAATGTTTISNAPTANTNSSGLLSNLFGSSNFRIDVHCHHIPDFYRSSLASYGITTAGGIDIPDWTPELAIKFMNKYGIQTQVLSISEPGVYYIPDINNRLAMARQLNDYTTQELIYTTNSSRAGRFGGFAVLPLGDLTPQDIKNACDEAVRAIKVLNMDGIGIYSNYNGIYLGDPKLEPLMVTLNSLGAMVFLHPVTPGGYPDIDLPHFLFEFPFDTTRAVINMMYKNVLLKYPNIRWLLAHAGGAVPFLSYRASLLRYYSAIAQNLGIAALDDGNLPFARMYYDTALSPAPAAMKSVREVTSVSHIMFATDWPFSSQVFVIPGDPAPQLAESFNNTELMMVNRTNALAEFPKLKVRLGV